MPKWTEQQRDAIADRGHSLIVCAAAGSGSGDGAAAPAACSACASDVAVPAVGAADVAGGQTASWDSADGTVGVVFSVMAGLSLGGGASLGTILDEREDFRERTPNYSDLRSICLMHVELLYHTPDPERAIATAARLCYAPVGASELMETMPEERVRSVLSTIMGSGHFSTLEHASYTFAVDGVSRALTHQLVRHRLASFNQQSQRYVKFTDGVGIVKPETVAEDEHANAVFDEAIDTILTAYQTMLEAGIPAEDARYILPNAAESKIVITMNIRELLHFFELRCCNRAQWEIRELAHRMLELVRPTAPYIFKDAGAGCVRGACPEGKMTCGNPFPRVMRD